MTSILAWPLAADDDPDQAAARALVQSGDILPLGALLERHRERLAGQLLEVELEREHGRLVYELEVLGEDGRVREFYFDARDAQLVKEELED